MNKKVLVWTGTLGIFALFGIWLAGRDTSDSPTFEPIPGAREVYQGAIDNGDWVTRCLKVDRYRKDRHSSWQYRCVEADTVYVGTLYFQFAVDDESPTYRPVTVYHFGIDARDYYGAVYNDLTHTLEIRSIDREFR